jgi:hypothetical protein
VPVRYLSALTLAAAVVSAAACGGHAASPESIARAWSHAVNAGDNEAAGKLFAPDAEVVQQQTVRLLHTRADAVAWNAALPCSGRILSVSTRGPAATVTFRLFDRPTSRCDGPGATVRALFLVRHGKIVLWHQLATTRPQGQTA